MMCVEVIWVDPSEVCPVIFCCPSGVRPIELSNEKNLTLPETNMAPENGPSQKETSIPTVHFRVLC